MMKNIELHFFIDTTVVVSAITGRNKDAWVLLESGRRKVVSLFVNDFIIKEMRRTLKVLHFSEENINYAVDYVMECCTLSLTVQTFFFHDLFHYFHRKINLTV